MSSRPVETMPISEFKATCLAVLERVRRTGASIIVTRRGEPVAEVGPPSASTTGMAWIGSMQDTATITGDIVSPASAPGDWDALTG
jgi:prevent-host-death family protein